MSETTVVAGPALNALVAEKVFGFHGCGYYGPTKPHGMHQDYKRYDTPAEALIAYNEHWQHHEQDEEDIWHCHWEDGWGPRMVPDYSDDIVAAWQVMEKMRADGFSTEVLGHPDRGFHSSIYEGRGHNRRSGYATADTAPLAICRAALNAMEDR